MLLLVVITAMIFFLQLTDNSVLVVDLISTQQASHEFFYPDLTNAALTLEFKFSAALPAKSLPLGRIASAIYIDSTKRVSKKVIFNTTT